jgi:hypothetical protein
MKFLIAGILFAAALSAQTRAISRPLGGIAPVPTRGALGGPYVSPVIGKPLGGVALPTFPGTALRHSSTRSTTNSRYVGPVYYIPNAFDTSYYPDTSAYAPPPAAPQQPVVVNQYFVTKGSSIPDLNEPEPESAAPAIAPGDPLTPPRDYYLIAYKDRNIYSALAYWIEGETLHYVTTENTHNQASLGLIDVDRTYKLNSDRSVPFSLPGK